MSEIDNMVVLATYVFVAVYVIFGITARKKKLNSIKIIKTRIVLESVLSILFIIITIRVLDLGESVVGQILSSIIFAIGWAIIMVIDSVSLKKVKEKTDEDK
jgi:hypothetical protein